MIHTDAPVSGVHDCPPLFLFDSETEERHELWSLPDGVHPELRFEVEDGGSIIYWEDDYYFGDASRENLEDLCIGCLHRVLNLMRASHEIPDRIIFKTQLPGVVPEAQDIDPRVSFVWTEDALLAEATAAYSDDVNISHALMLEVLKPIVEERHVTIHALGEGPVVGGEDVTNGSTFWEVDRDHRYFSATDGELLTWDVAYRFVRLKGASDAKVGDLIRATEEVSAYMDAFRGGIPTAKGVYNLVHSGHVEVLVGLPESSWFEIKETLYQFSSHKVPGGRREHQKVEFAKDVAAFANGGRDAVIVLGIKDPGKSDNVKLSAQKIPSQFKKSCFDVLDARIYPPLSGVEIAFSTPAEKQFVAIYIPAQDRSKMPFLVKGESVGDKYQGEFFSIVHRRGETKISTSAEEFHAQLQAGRAFLSQENAVER